MHNLLPNIDRKIVVSLIMWNWYYLDPKLKFWLISARHILAFNESMDQKKKNLK